MLFGWYVQAYSFLASWRLRPFPFLSFAPLRVLCVSAVNLSNHEPATTTHAKRGITSSENLLIMSVSYASPAR